jgi:hypothetical protein
MEIRFEDVGWIYLAQNREQGNKPSEVIKIRNQLGYY